MQLVSVVAELNEKIFSMLKILTVIFLLPFILGSCYSYRQIKQPNLISDQIKDQGTPRETVYIVNSKALPYEYGILKKAGLFMFTSDSLCNQKIQLLPLQEHRIASLAKTEALPAMVLTLGQMPIRFEKMYAFHYNLMSDSVTMKKEYELGIDKRVWFWDMFTFKKSRRNALAKNLHNVAKN